MRERSKWEEILNADFLYYSSAGLGFPPLLPSFSPHLPCTLSPVFHTHTVLSCSLSSGVLLCMCQAMESPVFACHRVFHGFIGNLLLFRSGDACHSSVIPGAAVSIPPFIREITSTYSFTFISFRFVFWV